MEPALVFRAATSRVYAVVTWVVAAVVVVAFAANGGAGEIVAYGAVPLLLAAIGWAAFWRPHVRVERDGVRMVNVLSTTWLPWAAVTGTQTRWGLEVTTHDRKVGAWGLPSRSALGRWTTGRQEQPVLPPLERLDTVTAGGSDPTVAADIVEEHKTGHLVDAEAAPTAERHLDGPAAGALLVTAGLALVALLR